MCGGGGGGGCDKGGKYHKTIFSVFKDDFVGSLTLTVHQSPVSAYATTVTDQIMKSLVSSAGYLISTVDAYADTGT